MIVACGFALKKTSKRPKMSAAISTSSERFNQILDSRKLVAAVVLTDDLASFIAPNSSIFVQTSSRSRTNSNASSPSFNGKPDVAETAVSSCARAEMKSKSFTAAIWRKIAIAEASSRAFNASFNTNGRSNNVDEASTNSPRLLAQAARSASDRSWPPTSVPIAATPDLARPSMELMKRDAGSVPAFELKNTSEACQAVLAVLTEPSAAESKVPNELNDRSAVSHTALTVERPAPK